MTATPQADTPRPTHAEVIAFASPGIGRSGQTSVVANTAWILAAAGWRVLVLDWSATPPPVGAYLSPPVAQLPPTPKLQAALPLIRRSGDTRHHLDRHEIPRRRDGYIDIVSLPAGTPHVPVNVPEGAYSGRVLRSYLRAAGYDYVLIDCPSQPSEATQSALAHLCDAIVVCFRPGSRRVPEVGRMLGRLRGERAEPPRLVAVLTQIGSVHRQPEEHLRSIREAISRSAAADGAEPPSALDIVQIPQHSYHERLAALLDDGPVLDGVLQVVRLVSAGRVTELPLVDPAVRDWYRRDFADLSDEEVIGTVHLAYHPLDRRWADWISAELRRCGAHTETVPVTDTWLTGTEPGKLVVVGHRPIADTRVSRHLRRPGAKPPADHYPTVLQVRIDEQVLSDEAENRYLIDLSGQSEVNARGRLLTHLGMHSRIDPPGPGAFHPRYPGGPDPAAGPDPSPPVWPLVELPARVGGFVGRAQELEELRDQLLAHPGSPVALVGPTGMGRAELAREYADRFAEDYDIIWWVPAESSETLDRALSQLTDRLRARVSAESPGARHALAESVHEKVGTDTWGALSILGGRALARPYLLIYENLGDGQFLDAVPRSELGHVLVITRPELPPAGMPRVTLGPLRPQESVALLRQQVPDMSGEDAIAIAEGVGHLPLSLRLAGAWLREQVDILLREAPAAALATVRSAAALLRERLATHADAAPEAGLRWIWEMIRTNLDHTPTGSLAARLAELASYLCGDGIGLRLVRSSPMVEALLEVGGADADRLRTDPIEFDRILWTGARFGVFDLTWGVQGSLRMNPTLQQAIRDSLPEPERSARQARAQLVLARFAPGILEDDDQEQRSRLAELQAHLGPSGAATATDTTVRRWVVRQVRYMQLQREVKITETALTTVETALTSWQANTAPDDPTLLWLRVEQANLLRHRGRYAQALAIGEEVRQLQATSRGEDHLRTLITNRGLGGDLRGLGRYGAARRHDSRAFLGFQRTLGDDHGHTLMAAHNYALSSYLDGDVHSAMLLQRDILRRRIRLLGEANPRTWWTADNLGMYQRELGHLAEAIQTLNMVADWVRRAPGQRHSPTPIELRVKHGLVVTWRWSGHDRLALQHGEELVSAYQRVLGDGHADTWACRLALAAAQHGTRDSVSAVRGARQMLDRYESSDAFGTHHPLTALCRLNLAIYLRGVNRFEDACELGDQAWQGLLAALSSDTHPWALAAMINQAGHLAAAGRTEEALELAETAMGLCRDDLPSRHPYLAAATENARLIGTLRPGATLARLPYRNLDVDIPLM